MTSPGPYFMKNVSIFNVNIIWKLTNSKIHFNYYTMIELFQQFRYTSINQSCKRRIKPPAQIAPDVRRKLHICINSWNFIEYCNNYYSHAWIYAVKYNVLSQLKLIHDVLGKSIYNVCKLHDSQKKAYFLFIFYFCHLQVLKYPFQRNDTIYLEGHSNVSLRFLVD